MPKKVFNFILELEVHAVTCPGVWLCPDGNVSLRIKLFKAVIESQRLTPIFPLLYHNKFVFQKMFPGLLFLTEVQEAIQKEILYAELIQWPRSGAETLLATFHTTLLDLLYPSGGRQTADIDLLMEPSTAFPGILTPKIETDTRTIVEEVIGLSETETENMSISRVVNSTKCERLEKSAQHRSLQHSVREPLKRQRKVCHSVGVHEKKGDCSISMIQPKHLKNNRSFPFSIRSVDAPHRKDMNESIQKTPMKNGRGNKKQQSTPLVQWSSISGLNNSENDSQILSSTLKNRTQSVQTETDLNGHDRHADSHHSQSCLVCSQYEKYFKELSSKWCRQQEQLNKTTSTIGIR